MEKMKSAFLCNQTKRALFREEEEKKNCNGQNVLGRVQRSGFCINILGKIEKVGFCNGRFP